MKSEGLIEKQGKHSDILMPKALCLYVASVCADVHACVYMFILNWEKNLRVNQIQNPLYWQPIRAVFVCNILLRKHVFKNREQLY